MSLGIAQKWALEDLCKGEDTSDEVLSVFVNAVPLKLTHNNNIDIGASE